MKFSLNKNFDEMSGKTNAFVLPSITIHCNQPDSYRLLHTSMYAAIDVSVHNIRIKKHIRARTKHTHTHTYACVHAHSHTYEICSHPLSHWNSCSINMSSISCRMIDNKMNGWGMISLLRLFTRHLLGVNSYFSMDNWRHTSFHDLWQMPPPPP